MALTTLSSCTEPSIQESPSSLISQPSVQELLTAVDERNVDAVLPFLSDSNQVIQELAFAHTASLEGESLMAALSNVDSQQAIYALGQQRDSALRPVLFEKLLLLKDPVLLEEVCVAIAKSSDSLQMETLIPYLKKNCQANYMRAAFHAIPSKADLNAVLPTAIEELSCDKIINRLYAAHFLSRSKKHNLAPFAAELFDAWNAQDDIDIKIALSLAFRNCPHPETAGFLNRELLAQGDERVRINLLRSCIALDVCEENVLLELLKDEAPGMAMAAGKQLGRQGWTESNDNTLRTMELHFEGDLARKQAILQHAADDQTTYDALVDMASLEQDQYKKAAILKVMQHSPEAANYISLHLDASLPKVIQTTAIDALFAMKQQNALPIDFNFNAALNEGIATQDEGVLAAIGSYLQSADASEFQEQEGLLREQLALLTIPKEVETYNEIVKAINHLYGDSLETVTPDFNHPIDWKLLSSLGDTISCQIKTSAGTIRLDLYPLMAPGSVASFIELASAGFYDGKFYHRVVPNFVVQAGCPRGDGWGGVDYSIRSEFGLHDYRTGSIGMASAGKDTESCQWFITHSPTPHLNGRYSIFGEVTAGMDVVRRTQVGTQIQQITIN
ncbi:MAG: peptidylprolyl isomerase [Flavobacteriales bacterium]|nr:peptidylprolyl isomerase [Flavobacteriales bacterium]